jgi:hypothetical protein
MTVACSLEVYFEVRECYASSLFYLIKIALVIWDILCFYKNLGFFFCEKWLWYFDGDCIESVAHFGYHGHFYYINSSNL